MKIKKLKELLLDPALIFLGIYLKKRETLMQQYMHTQVHCSIIYNNQDIETTKKEVTKKTRTLPFAIFIQHGTRSSSQSD